MRQKNKLNFVYDNFKDSINGQLYMVVFGLSILFSFFIVLSNLDYDFFTSFLLAYNNTFYVIFLLLIFLINTKNTVDSFKNKYEYVIRFETRKKYLTSMIEAVFFNNIMLLFFNIILVSSFLNFIGTGGNTILIKEYNISSAIYFAFCVLKFIILSLIISKINVCLLYKYNEKIIILLNIVMYCSIYVISTYYYGISSIMKIPLFFGSYFISLNSVYSSFIFEIICFVLYAMVVDLLSILANKFVLKGRCDI